MVRLKISVSLQQPLRHVNGQTRQTVITTIRESDDSVTEARADDVISSSPLCHSGGQAHDGASVSSCLHQLGGSFDLYHSVSANGRKQRKTGLCRGCAHSTFVR